MKKSVIIMLTICMVLTMFVGCSSGTSTSVSDENSSASERVDSTAAPSADATSILSVKTDLANAKIGVSFATLEGHYYEVQKEGIEAYAEKLGVNVVTTDASGDVTKQLSDLEDLQAQGCNIIMINSSIDPNTPVEFINESVASGVPIVCFDSQVSSDASATCTVVPNNTENGRLAGQWLAGQIDGPIKAIMVSGSKGNIVGEDRRNGVVRGIMESRLATTGKFDFQVVAQIYTDWMPDVALKNFEDIATSLNEGDFNCIITEADDCADSCIKVLQEMGFKDVPVASASDGSSYGMSKIEAGYPYACGINNPALIGRTALDVAIKILNGETVAATVNTPIICVTEENYEQYKDYAY